MALRLTSFALATIAAATLAACGGGSSDVSPSTPKEKPVTTLSGQAAKGPMKNALITLETWDETKKSWVAQKESSTLTDDEGLYTINFPEFSGIVRVKASKNPAPGAEGHLAPKTGEYKESSYINELDGKSYPLDETSLTSIVEAKSGENKASINIYTNQIASKAIDSEGKINNDAFKKAKEDIQTTAGEDVYSIKTNGTDDKFAIAMQNLLKKETCANPAELKKCIDSVNETDIQQLPSIKEDIKENDPRYGKGGEVLKNKDVVTEEKAQAPAGSTVNPAGFFVFHISNLQDFATGQYITAAKITTSENQLGYAFGIDFFSAQTKDGWKNTEWSYGNIDHHYGRSFFNGQLLTTCKPTTQNRAGSELQVVAFSENAQVVTNLSELDGKTFTEYSCGVDGENWSDFTNNNKTPFDYTQQFSISNGEIKSAEMSVKLIDVVNGNPFVEPNDGDKWQWSTYATAYKIEDKYFILMKDKDTSREQNNSVYGLSLAVSN